MQIELPITILPTSSENLYNRTIETIGKISWRYEVGATTRKALELLEERFPLETKIHLIDDMLSSFSKSVWGLEEMDTFKKTSEQIVKNLKLRNLTLEEQTVLLLLASREFASNCNQLYDMWLRTLNYSDNIKNSEILYEIAYTLLSIKNIAGMLFDKVSRIVNKRVKEFDDIVEPSYILLSMLVIRIYSIVKSMKSNDIENALQQTNYLSIERSRLLSLW